ncbi:peptidoglycan-binding protein [Dactylosporangium sp. AC04546]|uniref:peptidoglycan-binding protein n=1 Tax=Dactylosporangium sp. AC04546 TaxID=2862460 RepID=UPI001EDDF150|nr:peptidoglycan-binding protein [Dactylosporangium sp. AC04546]WVK86547.1 peptidoglycan-binding protein [Dactylosporangium sp. AC04546]
MRRSVLVGGAAVVAVLVVAAAVAATRSSGPVAAPAPETGTTTITRTTLVDVTVATGTLGHGPEQELVSRLKGTVTALPAVGTTIERGAAAVRIDDRPVVLFYGTLPAYRDLMPPPAVPDRTSSPAAAPAGGSVGADVKQFETNLKALGYSGFTVDDEYTTSTATAVKHWQRDLGLPETGTVELGRVVYAPGPIRAASHVVVAGQVAEGPLLTFTQTAQLVTALLPARSASLAAVQTKVTVELSDGSRAAGIVQSVGTPDPETAASAAEPMVAVVIAADDAKTFTVPGDGAVRVRFVASTRKDVLAVPVGALLALAEGGYGLEIVEGGTSRIVAVTTGLFADGRVEVSGPEIREGMTVRTAR